MTTTTEPTQTSRRLENGGVWIEGQLIRPPEGLTGPLVIGRDWLLEMVQTENGHIRVFFWAPFAIVCDFPQVDSILNGRFVGFSVPHDLRVTEAVSRLSRGEGILDTGYDVGFADTGRFYKNFRKITGTSPGRCKR